MIKWILTIIAITYSGLAFSGSVFECDLLNIWKANKYGDLEKPRVFLNVKDKFIIDRNTGIIEGDIILTSRKNLTTVNVISYGGSNSNFESIAIWEDGAQQITVDTVRHHSRRPFTALSFGGLIYTGLCKEGYR